MIDWRTSTSLPNNNLDFALKVTQSIDAMVGYWDRNQRCRFANPAYQDWFGISAKEMMGIPISELLGPIYELNAPFIRGALSGETQVFERAISVPDGTVRYSLASYHPDVVCGQVHGFTAHVTDVTRMKLLEMELLAARERAERLATHDYLTGIPNRVLLMDRIEEAIAHAKATGGLAGIILIDFDEFKKVNDCYGHDLGDHFLKEMAARMRRAIRSSDSVTRLGGDEFVFIATDLNVTDSLHAALHRLRLIGFQQLRIRGITFHPRFSCGVAVYPWHGSSALELMAQADRAMYAAKAQGSGGLSFADVC